MTNPAAVATPEDRAAGLFAAAFWTVFEDQSWVSLTVHKGNGSSISITGSLTAEYLMGFDPAEVATFLTWLTAALSNPKAICAVSAAYAGCDPMGWAWSLRDGVALDAEAAATVFGENVELRGAEARHITLTKVTGRTDMSGISLTEDVKAVINNHGGAPLDASNGHTIALRAPGTITVHVNAADEDAAREVRGLRRGVPHRRRPPDRPRDHR
ncbi:hypothetical protein ACSHXN_43900 (plasmid) [Streptomyces sp. HUAS TT11]|uniref:hypothetical protein n=1 Tax=Streptomyces sp. HUAS TT11 TaxID=3447508 RepID=UPI003F65C2FD